VYPYTCHPYAFVNSYINYTNINSANNADTCIHSSRAGPTNSQRSKSHCGVNDRATRYHRQINRAIDNADLTINYVRVRTCESARVCNFHATS